MNKNFCERMLYLRQEKGIGQVKLAKALNIGKATISYWENGKSEPTLSHLIAIANYFNVTIDYLAGLED